MKRLTAILMLPLFLSAVPHASAQQGPTVSRIDEGGPARERTQAGARYYDVRDDKAKKDRLVEEKYQRKPGKSRKDKLENRGQEMKAARARLVSEAPNADVQFDESLGAAETVGVKGGGRGRFLAPKGADNEKTARGFVSKNAALYGLTARQVAHLKKTADYANPAGNAEWVELSQEIDGIPVFQGELRALITPNGELAHTVGRLVPALDDSETVDAPTSAPVVSAANAVAAAAASIGVSLNAGTLVVKEVAEGGRSVVFERGPFDADIKVDLTYFPLEAGTVTLAWSMTLWQDVPAYYTLVDADGGDLLWQKNITDEQTQSATFVVYGNDSPAPISPSNALPGLNIQGVAVARTSFTLVSEHAANNLGWLNDGVNTTTGNNVDAGLDIVSLNGIDPGGRPVPPTFRVFNYAYNPAPVLAGAPGSTSPSDTNYRWGAVTNLFFWTNRYHDRLYELGFTEAARNFQQDNFLRNPGGLTTNARNGNDRVLAEAQDFGGTNNANFSTGADGNSGRMQMYLWPGTSPVRDGDVDNEIVLHELTHGTSNRLHSNASGLASTLARGMGEGWSDFYARSLLSSADEDVDGVYAMGAYATHLATTGYTNNAYYGIRRFPYAVKTNVGANGRPHNPLTFADTNPNTIDLVDGAALRGPFGSGGRYGAIAVHNVGEVWNMSLLEVRARVIKRMGYAAGNQRMLQLVTDAMKIDPVNPTLIDARNSLLVADASSFNNEDALDIWAGFATRGMGYGATMATTSANGKESFDYPIPGLEAVTFTDSSCNANGRADQNEDLILTLPLTNPLSIPLADVTAAVAGRTVAFGSIAPGQTVTKQILYTVPATAVSGGTFDIDVVVTSDRGTETKNVKVTTGGVAIVTFSQNFDGVTAPALPAGWSALVNPTGSPVWRTVNTSTQSAPNVAFVNFAATTTLSFLQSPVIPITSASARLQFRHNYNSEFEWDGGMIQLSLDGGVLYFDILDHTTFGTGRMIEGGFPFALKSTSEGNTNGLQSRAAWTGTSNGFLTTTIQLPAAAAGKNIQLRFIAGADSSTTVTNSGWTIDDVKIIESYTAVSANCVADLAVTQSASAASVVTGSNVTFDSVVTNNGPARATAVVVTSAVPAGTTFVSATAPAGWTVTKPAVGAASGSITFDRASFDATETGSFQVVVAASCGVANGTTITSSIAAVSSRPDSNGANNSASASVTASDPAPGINAPANILTPADLGLATAIVNYTATTTDNCPGVILSSSHPSGAAFPLGTTTVTLTAKDVTGNISTKSFDVTVSDTQPPVISGVTVSKSVLWPPQHQMIDVVVSYNVTDNAGSVTTALSVSSNEPIDGLGDGDTAPDWEILTNKLVRLRAERSGGGSGRIYTITITSTDGSGNQSSQVVTVSVPRDNRQ